MVGSVVAAVVVIPSTVVASAVLGGALGGGGGAEVADEDVTVALGGGDFDFLADGAWRALNEFTEER